MDKNIIKKALLAEGYADNKPTEATVDRLLSLKGTPAEMLKKWIEEKQQPDFESIEGVDSLFLRTKLRMKQPAIIIAYAMLLDNPKENADYFKHLANNQIGFYPNKKANK